MDKQGILNEIDKELSLYNEQRRDQGWTLWALRASTAGLLWTLISIHSDERLFSVFNLVVVGILSIHSARAFAFLLKAPVVVTVFGNKSKFIPHDHIAPLEGDFFDFAVGVTLFTAIISQKSAYGFAWAWGYCLLAVNPAVSISIFLRHKQTARPLPASAFLRSSTHLIAASSATILVNVALILHSWNLISSNAPTIQELKIAVLILAIHELISLSLKTRTESPLIDRLVTLRRDIVFSRITTKSAMTRLEISLEGLNLDDVMQERMEKFLSTMDRVEKSTDAAIIDSQDFSQRLQAALALNDTKQLAKLKDDVIKIESASKNRIDELDSLGPIVDSIIEDLRFYLIIGGVVPDESKSITTRLQKSLKNIHRKTDRLKAITTNIRLAIQQP